MKLINLKENFTFTSVFYHYFMITQYFIYKTLGLAPWTANNYGIFYKNPDISDKNDLCKISYVGSCYTIFLFFLISLFCLFVDVDESYLHTNLGSILEITSVKFWMTSILFTSSIPIIYIVRQKFLISVFNRLNEVDKKFNKCGNCVVENGYRNCLIFTLNFLMMGAIIVIMMMYSTLSMPMVILRNSATTIGGAVMVQYAMIINTINKRFKIINLKISNLGNIKSNFDQTITPSVIQISPSSESVLSDIDNLEKTYIELCEVCEDFDNFYGLPILISVFFNGTLNIFILYFLSLELMGVGKENNIISYQLGTFLIRNVLLFTVLTSGVTSLLKQVDDNFK